MKKRYEEVYNEILDENLIDGDHNSRKYITQIAVSTALVNKLLKVKKQNPDLSMFEIMKLVTNFADGRQFNIKSDYNVLRCAALYLKRK